ncbi:MAG: glycerate kinase [Comamonas sp.]
MNLRNILIPVGLLILVLAAHRSAGWPGVAAVAGGIIMWLLLHFTRLMSVMKKAANRPMGYVGSAVMLNAKLKPKVPLVHVVAMTRSLGERLSEEGKDPEIYRWTDGSQSHVTCEFVSGRLVKWSLQRPEPKGDAAALPTPETNAQTPGSATS